MSTAYFCYSPRRFRPKCFCQKREQRQTTQQGGKRQNLTGNTTPILVNIAQVVAESALAHQILGRNLVHNHGQNRYHQSTFIKCSHCKVLLRLTDERKDRFAVSVEETYGLRAHKHSQLTNNMSKIYEEGSHDQLLTLQTYASSTALG